MHRRLGEILVGGKALSAEVRDRALGQQVRAKGRFGTILMEMGAVKEDLLLRALSVQHGVGPATAAELANIGPEVIRLVPAKLAASLFVVPFKRSGRTLHLAMRDPKDLPAIDEISFLTGLAIAPFVALDARIQGALMRSYGTAVERRYLLLEDRLNALASGVASGPGQPTAPPAPPPPPPDLRGGEGASAAARVVVESAADPWDGAASSASAVAEEGDVLLETLESPPRAPSPTPPETVEVPVEGAVEDPALEPAVEFDESEVRKLRPVKVVAAVKAEVAQAAEVPVHGEASADLVSSLSSAESRDEIAAAVLKEASATLARAALFIAQPDRVIGWAATPEPPDGLRSFSISYSEPSVFASLRNTDGFYVGPCPELPGNRRVVEALGGALPATIAVVPVTLKGKSVLFLFGEGRPGAPPPAPVVLRRLAAQTAVALEILLLRNRLRSL